MTLPQDFDWIAERTKCTPTRAFLTLRAQVEEDVEKRITQMNDVEKGKYSFSFGSQNWQFWVSVRVPQLSLDKGVLFVKTPVGVDIADIETAKVIHPGVLTLGMDGQCRFRSGDVEYDFWQFRKLALEDLLFTIVARWQQ
jgi:hypothetical protein